MSTSEFNSSEAFQTTRPVFNFFEKKLIAAISILLIFNILDVQLTFWGISLHLIEEGNPIMQLFIEKNPLYLKMFKLLLPIILGAACWRIRDTSRKLVVYGMGLSLTAYLFVMIVHAYWIYIFIII